MEDANLDPGIPCRVNVLRSTLRGVWGAGYPALGGMQGCFLVKSSTHSRRGLIPGTAVSVSEISHARAEAPLSKAEKP